MIKAYQNRSKMSGSDGDSEIRLSVLVVTYNHEKFVGECLNSILMQRTPFAFKILVGVDASEDRTLEVCREFESRFPDKIKVVENRSDESPYIQGVRTGKVNLLNLLPYLEGEYWAICDGDDYWTDCDKLRKQVGYLDENRDFSMCFHNVWILEGGVKSLFRDEFSKDSFVTEDLFNEWFIPSSSVVGRGVIVELPDWYHNVLNGDLALHLLQSLHGKIGLVGGVMAVYRRHADGVSRRILCEKNLLSLAVLYSSFNQYCGGRFQDNIEKGMGVYLERTYSSQLHRMAYLEGRRSMLCPQALTDYFELSDLLRAICTKISRKGRSVFRRFR